MGGLKGQRGWRGSGAVLDADPEVIELPWPLVSVVPFVPLLLPSKLFQLAEAIWQQQVRGQGWVLLLSRGSRGH